MNLQALKHFSSEHYFSFIVCILSNKESEQKHGDMIEAGTVEPLTITCIMIGDPIISLVVAFF